MTVLSRSAVDPEMVTVQCDLCYLPLIITNREPVVVELGWRLASRGAAFDACPACQEARDGRTPLSLRRAGREQHTSAGRLPNLLMIGAAKAGTTSMHAYLDAHPEIFMATLKELRFFTDPDHLQWLDTYRQQFAVPTEVVGESSTMYTRAPALPGVAERMAALVPGARLLYVVRDPVERALASYVEERYHGLEPRPIEAAFADLDDPYNPYVAASRYAEQLGHFLRHYSPEQVLVVALGDLELDPAAVMRRVFGFLGVDHEVSIDTGERHNDRSAKVEYVGVAARLRRSSVGRAVRRMPPGLKTRVSGPARRMLTQPLGRPELPPDLAERLRAALAPDAERLRRLVGQDFADWSV